MKILFVNCCVREPGISRTKILCDFFLNQLKTDQSVIEIETIDLNELDLLPMTRKDLAKRNELIQSKEFDNEFFGYANEFSMADYILIGAPFWNFTLPSKLKVYLEWVCMSGITFCYENNEPVGLCKAKKMLFISSAGFNLHGVNNGVDYLKQLSNEFFGINEFTYCCPEELDVKGKDVEQILQTSRAALSEIAKDWI